MCIIGKVDIRMMIRLVITGVYDQLNQSRGNGMRGDGNGFYCPFLATVLGPHNEDDCIDVAVGIKPRPLKCCCDTQKHQTTQSKFQ